MLAVGLSCSPQDQAPELAAPAASGYSFVDVSAEAGIATEPRRSWGGTWVDYDSDGDPDLLVNRHFFPPLFSDHVGERYETSPLEAALDVLKFDRHACLWGDPNADALPDLLCTQGAERGKGMGPNQLLIQRRDGSFVDRAAALGLDYPRGRSRSINWVDFDRDGDFDLFNATQFRAGYPNRMFRNDGGTFRPASVGLDQELESEVSTWSDWDGDADQDLLVTLKGADAVAYENRKGRFAKVRIPLVTDADWLGASFGEFNGDRWPDLHLISETRSVVLVNRRGSFRLVHEMDVTEGRTGHWLDVDNDSDQDLFVLQGAPGNGDDPTAVDAPDTLLIREGESFRSETITETGSETGNGDSVAVSDHDRNGTLDLFVTNGYKRSAGPFLLMENASPVQNWAGLELSGGPGNPLALWIDVKVTTGSGTYWRRVGDGLNFRSQSEVGYVHLGLAAATAADVQVVWPDGVRDCLRARGGEVTEVEKGSFSCN